jgi:hypothetical protein
MKQEQTYFSKIKSIHEGNYVPSSDSSIASDEIELKNQIDNI